MRCPTSLFVLSLLLAFGGCRCPGKQAEKLRKLDVHTHFGPEAADRMISLMDQYGVDTVVNLSGGAPGQGLEEQLAAAARFPGRIIVFANLDWDQPLAGPGAHELGARGLKISKGLGLIYRNSAGELLEVDDPELDPVFEAAGELGLPIAIHTGDPVAFWLEPSEANERYDELSVHPGWSYWRKPVPVWEDLFSALERRIARHPKTTFISVHFGNAPEDPVRVAALLEKYPNLYVDTAARVPEIGRYPAEKMRALMVRHQDRILFGTDLGVGTEPSHLMLGSTGATAPTPADVDHFFKSTWRYFETNDRSFAHPTPIQGRWKIDGVGLPKDVLKKLYSENAARLLPAERSAR
jgi:predicted TIM-barrel fold metal-dependent hydrolase